MAGEGGGSRFDTRGVKVLGDALELMSSWRRRRNAVQGHRGYLKLPMEQSLLPAQNVLVKPESTPESGTYLSQHSGLLQPGSRTHWVHVQGRTLLQPLLPPLPPFLPQVCAGLCWDPQQHHSFPPAGELLPPSTHS